MAEIKNINRTGGNEINSLTGNQISKRDAPRVPPSGDGANRTELPVKEAPAAAPKIPLEGKILPDAATGRDATQFEAAKQLSSLGGASATDRLLGLDLRPTMIGALAPPPGNSEFLRHISPQMRRTMMRKLLAKQRERMRRLARFLREREEPEDESNGGETGRESFTEIIAEPINPNPLQLTKAITEIDKTARMLDILDEMLAMQDYTISQSGTFSQG